MSPRWKDGTESVLSFLQYAFVIALVLATVFVVFGTPFYFIMRASCNEMEGVTGRDTSFRFWKGCYIQTNDGSWVPEGNFRINEEGE